MIRRILANTLFILCTLTILCVGGIWVRTWFGWDSFVCSSETRHVPGPTPVKFAWTLSKFYAWTTRAGGGGIFVEYWQTTQFYSLGDQTYQAISTLSKPHDGPQIEFSKQAWPVGEDGLSLPGSEVNYKGIISNRTGFGCFWIDRNIASKDKHTYVRGIIIPDWTILLVAAVIPVIRLRAWRQRKAKETRATLGCCTQCGYSLSAHSPGQKCPECGTLIQKPPVTLPARPS